MSLPDSLSQKGTKMKLSVVIPCYNEAATIDKIIDAVLSAAFQGKEIIIVDDCSTDGTREILKEKIEVKEEDISFFWFLRIRM